MAFTPSILLLSVEVTGHIWIGLAIYSIRTRSAGILREDTVYKILV